MPSEIDYGSGDSELAISFPAGTTIRPEPKREPLPEPKRYEPPRGGRYRRRESGPSRFGAAWFRRDSASAPRMTQFSADGSVELVLW